MIPMPKPEPISPALYEATVNLIQNLLASEAFSAYEKSRLQFKSNAQAHSLIEQLSALQGEVRRKQTSGGVTEADLEELRAVQAAVQANAILTTYSATQQEAINFLREVNQQVSQVLGIDFASLAKKKTC